MLPILALEEQKKLAEAAIKAGIKRFIPSAYGSDSLVRILFLPDSDTFSNGVLSKV